jgi:prepilin-type N-terminal cleavage/methylation domain-containing protein
MKKAFSLPELLIAITITALVVEAAYFASNVGRQTFNRTSDKVEITQNARVLLDRISREIRQATEIVTDLPPVNNDPDNLPKSEIMFEDGHVAINRYITYRLEGSQVKRIITAFYFGASLPDSSEWVVQSARDEMNEPPNSAVISNNVIAEQVHSIQIWGDSLINIDLTVGSNDLQEQFSTAVFARNL